MRELIQQIPGDLFAAWVFGVAVGILIAWRFTRAIERFRDAVRHARHHWQAAIGFASFARDNVGTIVSAGLVFAAALFAIGFVIFLRVGA